MTPYPIQLDLRGKRCVVVGAGAVAARKVAGLLQAGAAVRVIAPQATGALQRLAADGEVVWEQGDYESKHLDGAFLVFAATDRPDVNRAVVGDARQRNILICRADAPSDGDFTSPATVTRGDLMLTVATSGGSPTLAAVLRGRLEDEFGAEWAELTALVGGLRDSIKVAGDEAARRAAVRRVIDDAALRALLRGGHRSEAEARARECLSSLSE